MTPPVGGVSTVGVHRLYHVLWISPVLEYTTPLIVSHMLHGRLGCNFSNDLTIEELRL